MKQNKNPTTGFKTHKTKNMSSADMHRPPLQMKEEELVKKCE